MSKALFIGEESETYPFRLAGVETLVPDGEPQDPAWVGRVYREEHSLLFVSEAVLRHRPAAVSGLLASLPPATALTIVPEPSAGRSDHLRFLRLQTMRALGVDTWTADIDVNAGDKR